MPNTGSADAHAATQNPCSTSIAAVRSGELLGPRGMLLIEHKGALYTLRATSKGGLILTK